MAKHFPFRYFKTSLALMLYVGLPLSLSDIEEPLYEHG
jgi:transposase-like protein